MLNTAVLEAISHYDVCAVGDAVEQFGLRQRNYADCHGVVNIPLSIATEVAQAANRLRAKEASIVQASLSGPELLDMIQNGQIS